VHVQSLPHKNRRADQRGKLQETVKKAMIASRWLSTIKRNSRHTVINYCTSSYRKNKKRGAEKSSHVSSTTEQGTCVDKSQTHGPKNCLGGIKIQGHINARDVEEDDSRIDG